VRWSCERWNDEKWRWSVVKIGEAVWRWMERPPHLYCMDSGRPLRNRNKTVT